MKILHPIRRPLGGIHPAYEKILSRDAAIRDLPLPSRFRVSMSQHLGAPAKVLVKKGDTVLKGQRIGEPAGFISAPVHAPTSGKVKDVTEDATATGSRAPVVEIEADGSDTEAPRLASIPDWAQAEPAALLARIAETGIVGMGGGGFPAHVKLSPPKDKTIDTLILNGAECEPYLTADFRLLVEHADRVWLGCQILRRILNVRTVRIAIEDNKPEAIRAMEQAMGTPEGDVAIVELPTAYPQGAEKQQIYAVTGREVPSGGLPMDVGTVVDNVGTAAAVAAAVLDGLPLFERITTMTGHPVSLPGNWRTRIGISFAALLDACGGLKEPAAKIIAGGPMMGFAQPSLDATITKTTSGILLLAASQVESYTSSPCIGCGRCVDACPMRLVPSELSQLLEAEDYRGAEDLNVLDCIECGCCSWSCPAHRPLVQHLRIGKARAMLRRRQLQAEKKS